MTMRVLKSIATRAAGNRFSQQALEHLVDRANRLRGIGSGRTPALSGESGAILQLRAIASPPYCVFDVGANKGQFLAVLLRTLGDDLAQAHCFEPSAAACRILAENTNTVRVHVNQFALGREPGTAELFFESEAAVTASLTRAVASARAPETNSEVVQVDTIDNYCARHGIQRIHLLKIDVEGHELDVLHGASAMLNAGAIDIVLFEFGPCHVFTRHFLSDFHKFLAGVGMQLYRVTPSGYLHPMTGYRPATEQFLTTNYVARRARLPRDGLRVWYFAPADIQVPRVDRQCIVRACEALGPRVERLTLVSVAIQPATHETAAVRSADELCGVYGVDPTFDVVLLPGSRRQEKYSRLRTLPIVAKYTRFLAQQLKRGESPIIYVKNYLYAAAFIALARLKRIPIQLVYELHALPRRGYQRRILRRCAGIITNSFALTRDLRLLPDFRMSQVIGTHQGVSVARIEAQRISRQASREKLGLSLDQSIAVYTGKVYLGYREIEYYIKAAELLPWCQFVIVGGRADHVEALRAQTRGIPNLHFTGFVPPTEVCLYHFAADVLLLYYPSRLDDRRSGLSLNPYRSPGKLFEYMASGTPIVAASYSVLREVLPEDAALYCERDRPQQLANAIVDVVTHPDTARERAARARTAVEQFTWEKRADTVGDFLQRVHARRTL